MNTISPKKLLHSKWTAVQPKNREKHFLIVEVIRDDDEVVRSCVVEAVYSGRQTQLDWRDFQNNARWQQGWT